ncbi:MAG: hypothetical protein B7Z72_02030 [Gemmatimonadetes bacterium 21-71-4]|nr:MAG: hypothetical protein B7Z72_02030 [Gemmatimonadetes bacterium 21-71-4]
MVNRDSLAKRDTTVKSDTGGALVPLPAVADSVAKRVVPKDTIKAPLAHAESPQLADPTGSYRLDRAQIFASGARSVGDLLDRLPGVTGLRTGWIATPMTSAYLGDAGRVRVFMDGLEYDSFNPHDGGAIDYSQLPLWPIEEITVERSASEVRVYLNTWRVDRTTPYTRTDITTGDQQTNLYRGFFGRRFGHGEALQFGVQQYGTSPERAGATSDQLSLMGRVGWARGAFSVDAFMLQVASHRGSIVDPFSLDSIPQLASTRRDAYVRMGYGDPDHGPWIQGMAGTTRYAFGGSPASTTGVATPADTTAADSAKAKSDTAVSGSQYLITGGFSRWGVRFSGAERYFVALHRTLSVPSVRAGYDWRGLAIAAFDEGKGRDSTSRRELSATFMPLSFIRFSASIGQARDAMVRDSVLSPQYRRLEAGIRIHDFWIGGGTITRGAVALAAPTLVNDSLTSIREPSATAKFVNVQGRVWRGINADVFALRWGDSTGFYRPQFQTRSQLYISTSLLNRFPDNTFHFFLGLTHEYRSATFFPLANGSAERVDGYRTIGAQLEIRIERAVLSYQFSNVLGEKYMQVPGFLMPRQVSIYGVRWEFWN